jgi:hypothetical protein
MGNGYMTIKECRQSRTGCRELLEKTEGWQDEKMNDIKKDVKGLRADLSRYQACTNGKFYKLYMLHIAGLIALIGNILRQII